MKKRHVIFLIIGFVSIAGASTIKQRVIADIAKTSAPAANVPAKQFDAKALGDKLTLIGAKYPNLDIGVSVININSGQQQTYGETAPFIGASTTKVLTAIVYLHQVEQGQVTLNDKINNSTAANQLGLMIEKSDNDAWNALAKRVGTKFLQAYGEGLGLGYDRSNNSLSTADMAILLQKLYAGQLLNKSNTALLLGHMHNSVESYIGDGLGDGYKVYHKAGWLDDRVMDSAIVTQGNRSYVLVVFSKTYYGKYDFKAGAKLFTEISKTVDSTIL